MKNQILACGRLSAISFSLFFFFYLFDRPFLNWGADARGANPRNSHASIHPASKKFWAVAVQKKEKHVGPMLAHPVTKRNHR